jgi:hypothetical protein
MGDEVAGPHGVRFRSCAAHASLCPAVKDRRTASGDPNDSGSTGWTPAHLRKRQNNYSQADVNNVSSSSFQAYEGIRILVPGAVVVTLYGAIVNTFDLAAPSPTENAAASTVGALLVGLFLRFVDLPARSATYRSADLPDRELRSWDIDPAPYGGYTNLFFVMLNASFPATIRDRGLYMGSMFRIGFESIYLIGGTTLAVLVTTATFPGVGPTRDATTATRVVLYAFAAGCGLVFAGAIAGRYGFRRRRFKRWQAIKEVWKDLAGDPQAATNVAVVLGTLGLVFFLRTHNGFAGALAVAVPASMWALIYVRGRPSKPGEPRESVSPPTAVFAYGSACAIGAVEAAARLDSGSTLNTRTALAWGIVGLIPAIVMATRGADRTLIGSYRTERTWLRINREKLIEEYKLSSAEDKATENPPPRP